MHPQHTPDRDTVGESTNGKASSDETEGSMNPTNNKSNQGCAVNQIEAGLEDGFPPSVSLADFMKMKFEHDDEPEICADCRKPLECDCDPDSPCTCGKSCTCNETDFEAQEHWFATEAEQIRSGFSRCNDGDMTWVGVRFEPVSEPGQPQDERYPSYFGGHTFRNTGTTQLVRAVSEVTGAPEPLCALVALHTISSALGKALQVSFAKNEQTSLGLYMLAFVQSGMGKTAISKYLASPLTEMDNERKTEWRKKTRPKLEAQQRLLTAKLKKLEKEYQQDELDCTLDEITRIQQELSEITASMHAPGLYMDDVTIQRACELLPSCGEQMTYFSSDAVSAIQNLLGKYDKDSQTDDSLLLKSYSMEPFTQGRLSRADVSANSPWASVYWQTQPDKWQRMIKSDSLRDGGLLARFLMARIECELRLDDGIERIVPLKLIQDWQKRCRDLFFAYRFKAEKDDFKPHVIYADKEACKLMRDFKNEVIRHGTRALMASMRSRLAGLKTQSESRAYCTQTTTARKHTSSLFR